MESIIILIKNLINMDYINKNFWLMSSEFSIHFQSEIFLRIVII